jgi:hypothetical protein
MVIGRRTAAASTSDRRFARLAAVLTLALTALLTAGQSGHAADEVFVQEDNTPIVSRPGVGGKILIRVDTGFALTVLGRDGQWLEVSSPVLKLPGDSLWVPAARVGGTAPGGGTLEASPTGGPVYRLEVTGNPQLRMRARCRIDQDQDGRRRDAFRTIIDNVPTVIELAGPVDCFVRMFGPPGELTAILRRIDGAVVASGTIYAGSDAVRVRSEGSWGSAGGFIERMGFIALNDRFPGQPSGSLVPPLGNPVPPLSNPVPPLTSMATAQ